MFFYFFILNKYLKVLPKQRLEGISLNPSELKEELSLRSAIYSLRTGGCGSDDVIRSYYEYICVKNILS